MTDYPTKPQSGQPLHEFISDSNMWSQLLDMLAAWRNGDFGEPPVNTSRICAPIGRNDNAAQIATGELFNLTDLNETTATDPAIEDLYHYKPSWRLEDPAWQTEMDNIVCLHRGILPEGIGPVRLPRYIPAQINGTFTEVYQHAMLDPDDPKKLRVATGGIFRIIGQFNDDTAILDTQEPQSIWRYRLTADVAAGEGIGELIQLDNTPYHDPTTFKFPTGSVAKVGDTGHCVHVGNDFYALEDESIVDVPWMRFLTTEKIVDREVDATVDLVKGAIINPLTLLPYAAGDTVTLFDPTNQWSEIETDATGTAYYRLAKDPESPLPEENRWEIEDCSLPVTMIRAKLKACLLHSTVSADAAFGSVNGVADWILSAYPDVDFPPGVVIAAPEDYSLTFQNPFHLDGVTDSIVTLRRRTDTLESDPGNLTAPKLRSSTSELWEVTEIDQNIARWALVLATGGTPIFTRFWEGSDPTVCGTPVVDERLPNCLKDGDSAICCYDPEANQYVPISAFLIGDHDPVTSMAFDKCTLNWVSHCGAGGATSLPIKVETVLQTLFTDGSEICATTKTIVLIDCGAESVFGAVCIDICPLLCECPQFYSVPEVCPQPPFCNCLDCAFEDGPISLSVLVDGVRSVSSVDIQPTTDPCIWDAEMDDGEFYLITYTGDGGWRVTGTPPEGAFTITGTGDCAGASLTDGNTTGNVTADGVECRDGLCCESFSGDERVTTLTANIGTIDITLSPDPAPEAPGAGGECAITFDVTVIIEDQAFPGVTCLTNAHCELEFDETFPPDGACIWRIRIDPCPVFPDGGGFVADTCLGDDCINGAGNCGDFDAAVFEITDPDGSVTQCVEPPAALGAMALPPTDYNWSPIAVLQGADGTNIMRTPARKVEFPGGKIPRRIEQKIEAARGALPGLGTEFVDDNEELFVGCKCKQTALIRMNHWDVYDVTEKDIEDLAIALNFKNPKVDVADFTKRITTFIDDRRLEQTEIDGEVTE